MLIVLLMCLQANSVYQHHSLGVNIRVVVTELILLRKEDVSGVLIIYLINKATTDFVITPFRHKPIFNTEMNAEF